MPIHIGELIRSRAEEKKLSQEELGKKISRTKQNVGDIFKRQSIDTELLLAISSALEFDFFDVYYAEEPLKSMREKELEPYRKEIEELKKELAFKAQRIQDLEKIIDSNELAIEVLKEEQKKYRKGE